MLVAHLAQHAVVQGQLGVCSCANAEVVAKVPVVEIVQALFAGLGEGGGFVIGVARCSQAGFDGFLHVGAQIAFRQFGREGGEAGVGLQRQLVAGEVRGGEAEGGFEVIQRLCHCLAGEAIHQIEVETLEVFAGELCGLAGFCRTVNAPQCLEVGIVEALDAE